MSYSVLLQFDESSDESLMKLWMNIAKFGGNDYLLRAGLRPHITISTFEDADINELCKRLSNFSCGINKFKLKLWSIGVFPFEPRVFYLSPVPSIQLIRIYQDFYETFKTRLKGISELCLPEFWVPHCAMAINISSSEAQKVLNIMMEQFTPIEALVKEVAIIESDGNSKYIDSYSLK